MQFQDAPTSASAHSGSTIRGKIEFNDELILDKTDGMFNFSQDTFTRQLVRPKLGQARIKRAVVSDLECSDGAVFSDFIDAIAANTDDLRVLHLVRVNSSLPHVRP